MAHRATRCGIAAGAATTIAVGALAFVGAGVAAAEPHTIAWDDAYRHLTRTVSDTTPKPGDTITITTTIARTDAPDVTEDLVNIKDRTSTCLRYVPGSATMNDAAVTPTNVVDLDSGGRAYVSFDFPRNEYIIKNQPGFSPTLSVSYTVGADCARDSLRVTGFDFTSGRWGNWGYYDKGPGVTVAKDTTTTTLGPVTGARPGQPTTLTATVTGAAQGDKADFYDGTTKLGTGILDDNGTATYQWTPATAGTRTLAVKFTATAFAKASESAPQTVEVTADVTSTTTLAPVPDVEVGKATTLTATVVPSAAGGTVEFKDGDTVLGTVPVGANGAATYGWTPNSAGAHTVHVTFSGRDGVTGSTATQAVTVAAGGGDGGTGSSNGGLGSLLGGVGSIR